LISPELLLSKSHRKKAIFKKQFKKKVVIKPQILFPSILNVICFYNVYPVNPKNLYARMDTFEIFTFHIDTRFAYY